MERFLFYVLTVWGLSNILAYMKIAKPLRDIHPLVKSVVACTACNSFWIGLFFYWLGFIVISDDQVLASQFVGSPLTTKVACGILQAFFSSGASWTLFSIIQATDVYEKY